MQIPPIGLGCVSGVCIAGNYDANADLQSGKSAVFTKYLPQCYPHHLGHYSSCWLLLLLLF